MQRETPLKIRTLLKSSQLAFIEVFQQQILTSAEAVVRGDPVIVAGHSCFPLTLASLNGPDLRF